MNDQKKKYFLPYQIKWINDRSPLRIIEKSRQVGITYADAFHSVEIASAKGARYDVYISTRDKFQARLSIEDCKRWAQILELVLTDLGEIVFDEKLNASAYVIQFSNGRRIYSLSSNPNALAGKRGHVKLDEFALHEDQRLLYRIAKPVTTWGGTLTIISTHRGINSVFNEIIRDIRENGNPMGWSYHRVSIEDAVNQGIVERINQKTGQAETRKDFLRRLRAECIDEEQWLQEYRCIPADESSAFITHDMLTSCEDSHLRLLSFEELLAHLQSSSSSASASRGSSSSSFSSSPASPKLLSEGRSSTCLYLGMDVARKNDLCVLDVGEKLGDVIWDRCRIELQNKTFSEIEFELYRLLALPQLKRACIDSTGMGMQLAERARERFGWKVEPVTFTAAVKEELAFSLRRDFEDRKVRILRDDQLRSDLRALRKFVTPAGNIRFDGEADDSHCDRTWAKALRQHAARHRPTAGGAVA
jgi:phage FluMu gp28-like protein